MSVETRNSDRPVVPSWVSRLLIVAALAVIIGSATPPGAAAAEQVQIFLDFYVGVFALLSMTVAVVSGLIATERMILRIGHRVLMQAVHRAASLLAFTFVVTHFTVKIVGQKAAPTQIVIPTGSAIGVGTVAFDLLLVVVVTGVLRRRFAAGNRPWIWRTFHVVAYVSWPMAITHGLIAGRSAANWVVLSYILCGGAVALAAVARLFLVAKPRSVPRGAPDTVPPIALGGTLRQTASAEQRQEVPR